MSNNIVILGIILSILYYEVTEISPGGVIVPGYIALFLDQPMKIILTILLSIVTLYIVNFLAEYTILYGKRKFAMMIIISFIIKFIFKEGVDYLSLSSIISISAIGYIVPGITAQEMDRQGVVKTVSSMLLVASVIKLIAMVMEKGILL
ncbi:poly-gamma-glutamate biosynthesis protein PgsC [uncultured Clostridium sp.]|uniref:poly-gamma-glutamate biosynthesis protein PgsC n=1 Tax=uncultured Clostridium sp. TaxID=59620 RepID=UPI0028EF9808|nr:poly-gamma-glutamate biosynthesis protein PgsC [uncultured Clostridium sp.]